MIGVSLQKEDVSLLSTDTFLLTRFSYDNVLLETC